MKKKLRILAMLLPLAVLASCGSLRKTAENDFYNKHNELKVKVKKGLFSSRHLTFGSYRTGKKESGVDKNIIDFNSQRGGFHFSFNGDAGNGTSVQAVYTDRASLRERQLPRLLDSVRTGEIFYAWMRGGMAGTLKNWELMVKTPSYQEMAGGDEVGVFRSLTETFTVNANDRFGSKDSYTNLCFEFRLRGVPVAAVTLNGDNRVWIDRQLDRETRFAIAGALAALMMR